MNKRDFMIGKTLLFAVLLSFLVPNIVSAQVACNTNACSVDAILVYTVQGPAPAFIDRVHYSFYGHNPKIPKPFGSIGSFQWWSIAGGSANPSEALQASMNSSSDPDVAFSREGYAVAVWSERFPKGNITCGANPPLTLEQSDIRYRKWNGTNWEPEKIAAETNTNLTTRTANFYHQPATAIDSNGKGLLIYTHDQITYAADCSIASTAYRIRYSSWNGSDFSGDFILSGNIIGGVPPASRVQQGPELAFTAELAPPGSITRHTALVSWYSYASTHSFNCPVGGTIIKDRDWVRYAIWNGTSWANVGNFIDNPPNVPADLSDNITEMLFNKKLGVSPDQFNKTKVAWGLRRESGNQCTGPVNFTYETWVAKRNSSAWERKAAKFDTGREPDVAFLIDNKAILIYQVDPFANQDIKWALENLTSTTPQGVIGMGNRPAVAALHYDKTLAVWSDTAGMLRFSTYNNATQTWSASSAITAGANPDISAHTGSPKLPHAEWTYIDYNDADDGNGIGASVEADRAEARQIGSTNLVNVIFQTDRPISNPSTRIFYVKKNSETVLRDFGTSLNMGSDPTLSDFMAFAVENYPAKRYWLDLEDHGLGYRYVCSDFASLRDNLNMTELRKAYLDYNLHFNIISYDACWMAMLEHLYQVRQFANYFTVSEPTIPGAGYNYMDIIGNLTSTPFRSDEFFANKTVESYSIQYAAAGQHAALSAIKASELSNLAASANAFANAVLANLGNATFRAAVINARNNTQSYRGSLNNISRDLYHFAQLVKAGTNIPSVNNAANNLMAQVNQTVVSEWHNSVYPNSHGITIYLQYIKAQILADRKYNETLFFMDTNWSKLVLNLSSSSFIRAQVSGSPYLFINIVEPSGNSAGGTDTSESRCGGFCTVTISGAQCLDDAQDIILPITSFAWTVNGTFLPATSPFNLTITLVINDEIVQQQSVNGILNPGQAASGQYSYINISIQGYPNLGNTINISLENLLHPNTNYILAASLGTSPGIPLGDGRVIPLNPDAVFFLSVFNGPLIGLLNSQSFLNSQGQALATWTIPNIPVIAGLTVYFAFVTIDFSLPIPQAILSISPAVPVTLLP